MQNTYATSAAIKFARAFADAAEHKSPQPLCQFADWPEINADAAFQALFTVIGGSITKRGDTVYYSTE